MTDMTDMKAIGITQILKNNVKNNYGIYSSDNGILLQKLDENDIKNMYNDLNELPNSNNQQIENSSNNNNNNNNNQMVEYKEKTTGGKRRRTKAKKPAKKTKKAKKTQKK